MLIGEYHHNLDNKGRLFMPVKLRRDLGDSFIVTRGIGDCLYAFSEAGWEKFSGKLMGLPETDVSSQDFVRIMHSHACECAPDKQGRILLPQNLRDFAGLEGEAVIIGAMTRVEIWSKENWKKCNERAAKDYESTLKKLSERGV